MKQAMRAAFLCAGLLGLAAAGCDAMRGGANPEMPLWLRRPNFAMVLNYSRVLVAPSRRAGEPYERGQPEIDPVGRRVFVGSSDHGLYALRADNGAQIWRFETLGFVQCAPLYDPLEDVVYFGSNDGALYKLSAKTGALLWRFMSNAEVSRRPVLSGGLLYAVNANDTLLAIEPATGKARWSVHRSPAAGMEVAGYAGPAVFRGKVYTGFSDGNVMAYDAQTGAERWQPVDLAAEAEQTLGEVPQQLDVDTTPVPNILPTGPVVYVASYAGGVFALDAETGVQVWPNTAVSGVSDLTLWREPAHTRRDGGPPEPERTILIASSGTSGLWGLDPETGRELWRRAVPTGGVSAPVPINGALLVSASRLGVFLVSPLGGELIDGIHVADGTSMTPSAFGSRAFVMTNGGTFLSLTVTPPI
ncbi:MAG: PQQ-binding-like beta-propeller repeat protein [Polyangiaceae bacterium]